MATLAQQLESVQAAIEAVISGAQSASSEGESLTRAPLSELRDMERELLNKVARGDRGRHIVAEF